MQFVITHVDRGNCRTYLRRAGDKRARHTVYCKYNGSDSIYLCSRDGEPSHTIEGSHEILDAIYVPISWFRRDSQRLTHRLKTLREDAQIPGIGKAAKHNLESLALWVEHRIPHQKTAELLKGESPK